MTKKILITGCSGFIGMHAVNYALKHDYIVVGFDHKQVDIKDKNFTFIKGDISDKESVAKAAKGCDYIFHLAAATSLPDFQYNLYRAYTINIVGFMNAIEAAKENKCKKFIYASSSGVYQNEYSEDSVVNVNTQRNHYGKSKLIDDMISDSYIDSYKLSSVGLRYFNVYGPGEEVKQRPSPLTCMIVEAKKTGAVTIFGDGKQTKDFIHIDDAIKISFMLMESEKSLGVYNVGTGIGTNLNQIAEIMQPVKVLYKPNPYLSSYIFYLKADTKKLFSVIGKYKFIKVEDGVKKLMAKK